MARLINFVDKWDGLHEAIHEVVTGTNKDDFKQVIRDYAPIFEKLGDKNKDWQEVAGELLGADFFNFPDPDALTPKTPDELEYSSPKKLIESLAESNPRSYYWWLVFNRAAFRLDFLDRVFSGWMEMFLQEVLEDIDRVRNRRQLRHPSGLILPQRYIRKGLTFAEELVIFDIDDTFEIIDSAAEMVRARTGRKQVDPTFRFTHPE